MQKNSIVIVTYLSKVRKLHLIHYILVSKYVCIFVIRRFQGGVDAVYTS